MTTAGAIALKLKTAKSIDIVIHRRADGDALGSAYALKHALPDKKVSIICLDQPAQVFVNVLGESAVSERLTGADLVLVLDCAQLSRTGLGGELTRLANRRKNVILVDHHQPGDLNKIANLCWQNSDAAATAEMVWEILNALRVRLTEPIARAIMLGIYSDTGGLSHKNTTSRTFRLAARLSLAGAKPDQIARELGQKRTLEETQLLGFALSNLKRSSLGIVAVKISRQALSSLELDAEDVRGLAGQLCICERAKAAIVLVETDSGWRGIIRGRLGGQNLKRLAAIFGGDGHGDIAGFLATKELISGKI